MRWTPEQLQNRFLIITQVRSGSQMLERTLSAHPDVVMRTWSTSPDNPHPLMGLDGFRGMDEQEAVRTFRGTMTHMWGDAYTRGAFGFPLDRFWSVARYFFLKVAVLIRKNQLRRFLSVKLACLLGNWGVQAPRMESPMVEFDFDEFLAWLHDTADYTLAVLRAFPNALVVRYEELVDGWPGSAAFHGLLKFLGIPQSELESAACTHRQEHRPAREIISNMDRGLEARFAHYGMEGWLA